MHTLKLPTTAAFTNDSHPRHPPVQQSKPPRLPPSALVRSRQLVETKVPTGVAAASAPATPLVPEPLPNTPHHVLQCLAVAGGGLVVDEVVLGCLVSLVVGECVDNALQVLRGKKANINRVRVGI